MLDKKQQHNFEEKIKQMIDRSHLTLVGFNLKIKDCCTAVLTLPTNKFKCVISGKNILLTMWLNLCYTDVLTLPLYWFNVCYRDVLTLPLYWFNVCYRDVLTLPLYWFNLCYTDVLTLPLYWFNLCYTDVFTLPL